MPAAGSDESMKFALICLALLGCAELPPCPKIGAAVLQSQNDGVFYLGFTIETIEQLRDMIRKEALGECAFPKKGDT